MVLRGVVEGNACFEGAALTLTGSPNNPALTVIDAQGLDSVMHIFGFAADIVINGFTVTGGSATGGAGEDRGGGIYVDNSTSLTIMNTIFQGNIATVGGGLYTNAGNVTLVNCQFMSNDGSNGGGVYANNSTTPTSWPWRPRPCGRSS